MPSLVGLIARNPESVLDMCVCVCDLRYTRVLVPATLLLEGSEMRYQGQETILQSFLSSIAQSKPALAILFAKSNGVTAHRMRGVLE